MKTSTLHLLFALLLWPLGLLGQVRPEVPDVLPLREDCTNWSKTATLTFTKNNATAFDAGGRGFDDAVFDGLDCEGPTKLYPFIAIEEGQKGKVNYTTDSKETIFFRPVDQKANVVQGQPNGTELFALNGKKTLWEAYTSVDNQDQILGKINVLPFEPKTIKLYIKPVDEIKPPSKADVENYLASVFGDYFINFEVEILGKMTGLPWDENGDGKLASGDGEHGSLATYTSEQRTLISAFKKVHQRGKDELVAFWAPAASKAGLKGFFPQGRAYGFVYTTDPEEQDEDKTFHTLAHELGHGAFNLQHTFDRFGKEKAPAGTTDNLMDYTSASSATNGLSKELYAYQWPLLHKPLKVLGIEKGDEDSEQEILNEHPIVVKFEEISDDFEVKKNSLKISYKLENYSSKLYNYNPVVFIKHNEEIILLDTLTDKTADSYLWDGKNKVNNTYYEDLDDFSIYIGVPKTKIDFFSIDEVIGENKSPNMLYSLFYKFSSKNWTVNKWEKDYDRLVNASKINNSQKGYYESTRNHYTQRLKEFGLDSIYDNGIDYLNDHIVSGDFMGNKIGGINIRFLYVLRKIEEKLGRSVSNSDHTANYISLCSQHPDLVQNFTRMSTAGGGLSDHGLGFAFDYDKNKNPYLRSKNIETYSIIYKLITLINTKDISGAIQVYNDADEIRGVIDGSKQLIDGVGESKIFKNGNFDFEYIETVIMPSLFKEKKFHTVDSSHLLVNNAIIETRAKTLIKLLTDAKLSEDNVDIISSKSILRSKLNMFENDGFNFDKIFLSNSEEISEVILEGYFAKIHKNELIKTYLKAILNTRLMYGKLEDSILHYNFGEVDVIHYNNVIDEKIEEINDITSEVVAFSKENMEELKSFKKRCRQIFGMDPYAFYKNLKGPWVKFADEIGRSYKGYEVFKNGYCSYNFDFVKNIIYTNVDVESESMRLLWGGGAMVLLKTLCILNLEKHHVQTDLGRKWFIKLIC